MTTNIEFNFDVKKTVQVAGAFLRFHYDSMIALRLLSLLYIADRKALKEVNKPLTGDIYISTNYGPMPSKVFSFIRGEQINDIKLWEQYISTGFDSQVIEACTITLLAYAGDNELSIKEEEIIKEVYYQFKDMDTTEVALITRSFKEWQIPAIGQYLPINNVKILKNLGKTKEQIEYIKQVTEREAYLNNL